MNKAPYTESLPQRWQSQIAQAPSESISLACGLWGQQLTQPLKVARQAERALANTQGFGVIDCLFFNIAVSTRIQTLSDFHQLDQPLKQYLAAREQGHLNQSVIDECDVFCFGALVFRQPGHSKIHELSEKALAVFERDGDAFLRLTAANYLLLYRIWCGDLLSADALGRRIISIRESSLSAPSLLLSHSIMSMLKRLFLDYDASYQEVKTGLALAKSKNIHCWDSHLQMQGAFLALTRHNLNEAQQWLDLMETSAQPEQYLDRSGYHYSRAWLHILSEEAALAIRHAEEAVTQAESSGAQFPQAVTHLGLAQLYLEQRHIGKAIYHISHARKVGRVMDSRYVPFARGLARAHLALRLGMHRRCDRILAYTFKLGREQHYVNYPWWRGDVMAQLCARALAANIESEYTIMLIRKRRLQPPSNCPENGWYWPLKMNLMGAAEATVDDEPLTLSGKGQELLFLLATLGSNGQAVSKDRLQDILWPDSDGDHSKQALDTTVHRLRRQLGTENLILSSPGGLALNAAMCQVDLWQFMNNLNHPTDSPEVIHKLLQAVSWLSDDDNPWSLNKSMLLRKVNQRVLEQIDSIESLTAEQWLETLLDSQPANERLWQALISHHLNHDLTSAALQTWQRCQQSMQQHANVAPSAQTQALIADRLGLAEIDKPLKT